MEVDKGKNLRQTCGDLNTEMLLMLMGGTGAGTYRDSSISAIVILLPLLSNETGDANLGKA